MRGINDYEKEALRQLSDPEAYLKITEDQAKSVFAQTKRLADQLRIGTGVVGEQVP